MNDDVKVFNAMKKLKGKEYSISQLAKKAKVDNSVAYRFWVKFKNNKEFSYRGNRMNMEKSKAVNTLLLDNYKMGKEMGLFEGRKQGALEETRIIQRKWKKRFNKTFPNTNNELLLECASFTVWLMERIKEIKEGGVNSEC